MAEINTTKNVAARLGISQRLVQRLIGQLNIEPTMAGKSQILSERDVKRLEKRNTQRGAPKKGAKK